MPNLLLKQAVRNNAEWCDLVAASHAIPTEWSEEVWSAKEGMPPLYPNIVTLEEGISSDRVAEIANKLPEHCACKDSFADLDLSRCGFEPGFEAHWYSNSGMAIPRLATDAVSEVTSSDELEAWIAAWGETPRGKSIFKLNLLQPKLRFLFRSNDGEIDAGLIMNSVEDVVGISNFFGQYDGISQCVVAAHNIGNGQALVGYGSTDELYALKEIGFYRIGELRVWFS